DLVVGYAQGISQVQGGVTLLPNNGDGSFGEPKQLTTGYGVSAVAVADLDGDGIPDIASANSDGTVSVLRGSRDGSFQSPTRYTVGASPGAVAVADVNGDGEPDLVVARYFLFSKQPGVSVLLNTGDGTFAPPQPLDTGLAPTALAVGDVNADGRS